jgi:proteasomal ATPase-associated factor 1
VILSGGADTLVKIWSAETGQCAATLAGHSAGVTDLAVIERGRNVISTCRDGSAKLWDCSKSACITTLTGSAGDVINGCCLVQTAPDVDLRSPDHTPDEREVSTGGKMLLLACESGLLHAFGLQSRKKIMTMSLTSPVNCCASVNETLIVCGTQDSTVHGIDLRNTSQPVISLQEARSAILSILPLKQTCFVTTGDGSCFTSNVCALSKSFDNSCCLELTGPDCDPVYRAATDGHNVFTCCRDSVIRKYQLNTDWSTF